MGSLLVKPNFIVIGVPKAGTTFLHECLRLNDQVYLPSQKELHYFSYPELAERALGPGDRAEVAHLCSTRAAYEGHYRGVKNETAIGEISPSYFFFSHIARQIKLELGNPSMVVLLRDPIARAYSNYMHLVRDGRECLTFREALEQEASRKKRGWSDFWLYAEGSLYSSRLEHYVEVFGWEKIHLMVYEDLVREPETELSKLFGFLGIGGVDEVRIPTVTLNRSGPSRWLALSKVANTNNAVKRGLKIFIPRQVGTIVRRMVNMYNVTKKPPLDSECRQLLKEKFRNDVARLSRVSGMEFPLWNFK